MIKNNINKGLLLSKLSKYFIQKYSKEPNKFSVGDTVSVCYKVKEGSKEREQFFNGIVLSIRGKGISRTFIVRKISFNKIAVEKIFPLYSPKISKIKLIQKGKVRRAKLFYLRNRAGKSFQVKKQK